MWSHLGVTDLACDEVSGLLHRGDLLGTCNAEHRKDYQSRAGIRRASLMPSPLGSVQSDG